MSDPALGLTMLAMIVVAIMMGFPTAFTMMGLGMIFGFVAFYDPSQSWLDNRVFDLFVQRTFGGMNNETLLSIPLFVFMGYIIERAALVDKMFFSVQLAFRRLPASLAVTTLLVCAFWGIASGIVGAVVVLMGVIAMRPMLNAGYDVRLASGVITAGGTLGILIPPSVMLIVYAAVAGQSIVKLYAAAMLPGFFLTFLYLVYIIGWALVNPKIAPKLPADKYRVPVPDWLQKLERGPAKRVFASLLGAVVRPSVLAGARGPDGRPVGYVLILKNAFALLVPAFMALALFAAAWWYVVIHNAPEAAPPTPVSSVAAPAPAEEAKAPGALAEPPAAQGEEKPQELGAGEDEASEGAAEKAGAPPTEVGGLAQVGAQEGVGAVPEGFYTWFWAFAALTVLVLAVYYARMDGEQLEILKMLEDSVVPLGVLTFIVLAVILFGITTASESAGVGAVGALYLAGFAKYPKRTLWSSLAGLLIGLGLGSMRADLVTLIVSGTLGGVFAGTAVPWAWDLLTVKTLKRNILESTFLTAKTTAMVCWLFVGSALFSAVFALHGGQQLIEKWVLSFQLSPLQFLILSQAIIFLLGWPLEWTEIIVIFVPIFIPLLTHFQVDPVLFATMVAVNLQAAFLSPPVAMSAFYLKGVAPKHVTLNQIFAGMMPYMLIVILCLMFMYIWPGMTLWLPNFLYGSG
ncbi:MAG TPA: TRAP transporter large permease subunit [Burkholderiales bacterium]|jgi:TRAP-type mannitol/chloroaromatic compound transport system permease large subunit